MLNNSNIKCTTSYPVQPIAPATAPFPSRGYYIVNQPYFTHPYPTPAAAAAFVSPVIPIAQVNTNSAATAATTAAASNDTQSCYSMSLGSSRPFTGSRPNTQLPPIQDMLNTNIRTPTIVNTTPSALKDTTINRLMAPATFTKGSSASSSPGTNHIILPPIGYTNTHMPTPTTSPAPLSTSIHSPTPTMKSCIPVVVAPQGTNQQHHLPLLSTQFRPHEINSVARPISSSNTPSLILRENNSRQDLVANSLSTNNPSPRQQSSQMNFSFLPGSCNIHIAKNGTIMKTSGMRLQSKSIIGRSTSASIINNNNNNNNNTHTTSRKRRRTTREQRQILKEAFVRNKAPSKKERLELAQQCNMSEKAIQVWFQNQRQYMRREQNLRALQYFQVIS